MILTLTPPYSWLFSHVLVEYHTNIDRRSCTITGLVYNCMCKLWISLISILDAQACWVTEQSRALYARGNLGCSDRPHHQRTKARVDLCPFGWDMCLYGTIHIPICVARSQMSGEAQSTKSDVRVVQVVFSSSLGFS